MVRKFEYNVLAEWLTFLNVCAGGKLATPGFKIQVGAREFSPFQNIQTASGTKVKNGWSYVPTSTPHQMFS